MSDDGLDGEWTEDVPLPLIETGDWVRLTRPHVAPYYPMSETATFTHGIVVEVISRFSFRDSPRGEELMERMDEPPAERVSCHLFNAETKEMYCREHPEQPMKPEYVDHHISSLALVHKAGDPWGNEYDEPAAPVYRGLGFTVPEQID